MPAVAADAADRVYVKPLGRSGEKGTVAGRFQMPHVLCVDSRGDVCVAEVANERVRKFAARAAER